MEFPHVSLKRPPLQWREHGVEVDVFCNEEMGELAFITQDKLAQTLVVTALPYNTSGEDGNSSSVPPEFADLRRRQSTIREGESGLGTKGGPSPPEGSSSSANAPWEEEEEPIVPSLVGLYPVVLSDTSGGLPMGVRYSLDHKFLAVQRHERELLFVECSSPLHFKFQTSKPILGFHWLDSVHVVVVTTTAIEIFFVDKSKGRLKSSKSVSINASYYLVSGRLPSPLPTGFPDSFIHSCPIAPIIQLPNGNVSLEGLCFLVPADSKAHSFKPIIVLGPKSIKTLSKVHLEVVNSSEPVKREDVSLVFLYGDMFLSHLTAEPAIGNPQLDLYRITREMSQKFIFLQLYNTPPFCLSVLDNLLLVHAPGEKNTTLFDIRTSNQPIAPPTALAPFVLTTEARGSGVSAGWGAGGLRGQGAPAGIELYRSTWQYVYPNRILDRQFGFLWEQQLNLADLALSFQNKINAIDFLVKRKDSKALVLETLHSVLEERCSLHMVATVFDMLNRIYYNAVLNLVGRGGDTQAAVKTYFSEQTSDRTSKSDDSSDLLRNASGFVVIEEVDMYKEIFVPLEEEKLLDINYFVCVLVEYVRSLHLFRLPVHIYLQQFVIYVLVKNSRHHILHQFLQYHVIGDSPPVALQLLSLESEYAPAYQLGIDMLTRLCLYDELMHVLLSRGQVYRALRIATQYRHVIRQESRTPHVFLQAAYDTNDPRIFYNTYMECLDEFGVKSIYDTGDPDVDFIEYRFVQDAKCSEFEDLFIKMFLQEESGEDRGLFPPLSVSRLHKDVGTIDSPQAPNL